MKRLQIVLGLSLCFALSACDITGNSDSPEESPVLPQVQVEPTPETQAEPEVQEEIEAVPEVFVEPVTYHTTYKEGYSLHSDIILPLPDLTGTGCEGDEDLIDSRLRYWFEIGVYGLYAGHLGQEVQITPVKKAILFDKNGEHVFFENGEYLPHNPLDGFYDDLYYIAHHCDIEYICEDSQGNEISVIMTFIYTASNDMYYVAVLEVNAEAEPENTYYAYSDDGGFYLFTYKTEEGTHFPAFQYEGMEMVDTYYWYKFDDEGNIISKNKAFVD